MTHVIDLVPRCFKLPIFELADVGNQARLDGRDQFGIFAASRERPRYKQVGFGEKFDIELPEAFVGLLDHRQRSCRLQVVIDQLVAGIRLELVDHAMGPGSDREDRVDLAGLEVSHRLLVIFIVGEGHVVTSSLVELARNELRRTNETDGTSFQIGELVDLHTIGRTSDHGAGNHFRLLAERVELRILRVLDRSTGNHGTWRSEAIGHGQDVHQIAVQTGHDLDLLVLFVSAQHVREGECASEGNIRLLADQEVEVIERAFGGLLASRDLWAHGVEVGIHLRVALASRASTESN